MLDIVAVPKWARENASQFGGDPSNVTVCGQSGGGGKVSALMAMRAAQGLFHRAIVQSGSSLRMRPQEDARRLAAAVVAERGLTASQVNELQRVPLDRLYLAAKAAAARLTGRPNTGRGTAPPLAGGAVAYGPVVDGQILPHYPFDPAAPAISANVPMLIGTNENEFVNGVDNPENESRSAATDHAGACGRLER